MEPTRREGDHPEGRWTWVKGPTWWREMPAVWKALGIIAFASMAGATAWATLSTQIGLPAIVQGQGQQIHGLEEWRDSVNHIIPMVAADHILIQTHKIQLDSVTTVLGGVWCVMRAEAHGLDPLRECFVPRPGNQGRGDYDN